MPNSTGRRPPADGWLVVDKPPGPSSAATVGCLRRWFRLRKAGHAGTLDPMASGVLPVAFGEATKTVSHAMAGRKRYRFTVAWGEARDTDDAAGRVIGQSDRRPGAAAIAACLPRFIGEIRQRPPDFSAIRVGGRRAYALARSGQAPDLPARPVRIHALRLVAAETAERAEFLLDCGSGTYVRSIARDLGEALGCLGHVTELRRLCSGPFAEADAHPLAELRDMPDSDGRRALLLPVSAGLADIPALVVSREAALRIRRGLAIPPESPGCPGIPGGVLDGTIAWASCDGHPVAIGRVEGGAFRPSRVLHPPEDRA